MKKVLISFCAVLWGGFTFAQVSGSNITGGTEIESSERINTITTAVPFLMIAPDTRAGAMGDVGVSTSPDANSIHWNASKLAFVKKRYGLSISYTPWLRKLVNDINLSYVSGFYQLDDMQTIGASLRYFTLGNIQFTNEQGQETVQFRPNEVAIDLAYGRKLTDNISGGLAVRFVNSNLTGGINVQGAASKPGRAVATDVTFYYQDEVGLGEKDGELAFGLAFTNIGNKMSYSETSKRDFIPINLRLGPRYTLYLDDVNKVSLAVDFNKLLVPTPPEYARDSTGQVVYEDGELSVLSGKDPDRAVVSGMFGSFTDAPGVVIRNEDGLPVYNDDGSVKVEQGSRFREEMREFNWAVGMEYWYDDQFALRAGYFWEHQLKGNRKYMTLGAGIRYSVFGLDFSYLIPIYFQANRNPSPLQNTLRFTLSFNFDNFKKSEDEAAE